MKKLLIISLVLLVLCGCSKQASGNAQLSSEKRNVFYKIDGKEYTSNDIFQNLKSQQASNLAENVVAKFILDKKGYDYSKDISDIEETFDLYAQMYGGEESFLSSTGYESKEQFVDYMLENSYTSIYLTDYVKNHISNYESKYNAKYIEYVNSSDEKKITSFQKNVAKKQTFEKALEKAKFENGESILNEMYSNSVTTLPDEVKTAIENLTSEDLCSDVIKVETTSEAAEGEEPTVTTTYYVIHVLSDKPSDDYNDEYTSFVIQNEGLSSIVQVLNEEHTVEFYDEDFQYVFNSLRKTYATSSEDTQEVQQ